MFGPTSWQINSKVLRDTLKFSFRQLSSTGYHLEVVGTNFVDGEIPKHALAGERQVDVFLNINRRAARTGESVTGVDVYVVFLC